MKIKYRIQGALIAIMIMLVFGMGTIWAAEELRVLPNPFPIFVNNEPTNIEAYNINDHTYGSWADLTRAINKAFGKEVLTLMFDQVNNTINFNVKTEGVNLVNDAITTEELDITQPESSGTTTTPPGNPPTDTPSGDIGLPGDIDSQTGGAQYQP